MHSVYNPQITRNSIVVFYLISYILFFSCFFEFWGENKENDEISEQDMPESIWLVICVQLLSVFIRSLAWCCAKALPFLPTNWMLVTSEFLLAANYELCVFFFLFISRKHKQMPRFKFTDSFKQVLATLFLFISARCRDFSFDFPSRFAEFSSHFASTLACDSCILL